MRMRHDTSGEHTMRPGAEAASPAHGLPTTSGTTVAMGINRYGPPEALSPVTVRVPAPGSGQLRIRVVAASVNPADTYLRSGRFRLFMRPHFPFVPGADVAGVVTHVGEGVHGFTVGDAVAAMLPSLSGGGYAGAALLSAADAAAIPPSVSFAEAAALPLTGLTALQIVRDAAGITGDEQVMVVGAAGGVGSNVVQLAVAAGAAVTAVGSTAALPLLDTLGADRIIDRSSDVPLFPRRRDRSPARDHDVVVDASGLYGYQALRRRLRPGGVAVTTNPLKGNVVSRALSTLGSRRLASVMVRPDGTRLRELFAMVTADRLHPVVADVLHLSEAADAHRRSETGRTHGKLVLAVDPAAARQRPGAG